MARSEGVPLTSPHFGAVVYFQNKAEVDLFTSGLLSIDQRTTILNLATASIGSLLLF